MPHDDEPRFNSEPEPARAATPAPTPAPAPASAGGGTKAAVGGGVSVLLIVLVIGAKVVNSINRASRSNTSNPILQPDVPPNYKVPYTPPSTALPIPATTAPTVTGSSLDLTKWSVVTFDDAHLRLFALPNPETGPLGEELTKEIGPGLRLIWRFEGITLLAQYQDDARLAAAAASSNPIYAQTVLDSLTAGASDDSKNIKTGHITLRNFPGRDLQWFDEKENEHLRARLFVQGLRHYMLLAVTDAQHKDDPALDAFLNSFDFVGEPKGK